MEKKPHKNGAYCFFGVSKDVGYGITAAREYFCAVLITVEDGVVRNWQFLAYTSDRKACVEKMKSRRDAARVYAGGTLTFDPPTTFVSTGDREGTTFAPLSLEDLYWTRENLGLGYEALRRR